METTPTAPPRPLTAAASRRAWSEPRVRFWWTAALVLLVLGTAFTVQQLLAWARLRDLVTAGRPVPAKIIEIEGYNRPGRIFAPTSVVKIQYTVDGRPYDFTGPLDSRTTPVQVGDALTLRVDPNEPENWTLRTEGISVGHYLIGGILVLPVLVGGLIAAFVQRALVVRAWKNNPAIEVTVVGTRQSPLAPRSRLLRCTPGRIGDLRVMYVYLPRALGSPVAGESIRVVPLSSRSAHALAVDAFEKNR